MAQSVSALTLGIGAGISHYYGRWESSSCWLPVQLDKGKSGSNLTMVLGFPRHFKDFPNMMMDALVI